jgi:hypothetical protein
VRGVGGVLLVLLPFGGCVARGPEVAVSLCCAYPVRSPCQLRGA